MRLIDYFDRGVSMFPDQCCLLEEGSQRTYQEVSLSSHRIANGLLSSGLVPGDRVALLSNNTVSAYEAWIGIARAGGVWLGLAAMATLEENIFLINDRGATWLFYHPDFDQFVKEYREHCPTLIHFVALEGDADETLAGLMNGQANVAPELLDEPGEIISHFTTGGTTGSPKGAMWSNLTWQTWTSNIYAHLPIIKKPVFLAAASMSHATGVFVWSYMAFGSCTVCIKRADPETVMTAIEKYHVTHTFLPPTVIYMMLAHPRVVEFNFESLEHLIYGGAPMSADKVSEAMSIFGQCMAQIYGQAEVPITISILSPSEHADAVANPKLQKRLLSCGRPALFTRVGIMDELGNLLKTGQPGEIVIQGNNVCIGYFGKPRETEDSREYGWHHTGDIGYLDEDGYLYVVDRKKDMIISGGLNIYPIEVERVLWSHPLVQDCAVVGVPDEKWGEAVNAVIELKSGNHMPEDKLIKWCRDKLAAYKIPKRIHFRSELPRSSVGKVLRRQVRSEFWAHHSRKV